MFKKRPFHPILLSIFPVLSIYVNNIGQVRYEDVLIEAILFLGVACILLAVINFAIKNWNKSALVVSIFLILLFSFGHVQRLLIYYLNNNVFGIGRWNESYLNQIYLIINFVLLILGIFLILRVRSDLTKITEFFNALSLGVVSILIVNGLNILITEPRREINHFASAWLEGEFIESDLEFGDQGYFNKNSDHFPDIYYIILDGYGRSDILRSIYNLDNSDFLSYLRDRGFYIADKSTSNYNFTWLSMSSSLNFMYLDVITNQIENKTRDTLPLEIMIEHNRVVEILRRYGYKIVTFSSEDWVVDITSSDYYISSTGLGFNAFRNELFNTTPLPTLLNYISSTNQYSQHRDRVMFTLNNLPEVRKSINEGPIFVFAHIMAPHPPFVFDENGRPVEPDHPFFISDGSNYLAVIKQEDYIEGYRDQTKYISGKISQTIEEILNKSSKPPIVIIQGDHGPGVMFDFESLEKTNIDERMSILNAYYFPDQNYKDLYRKITPVNTFRIILNNILHTETKIVKDRNYFVTLDQPYNFIEITKRMNNK